MRKHIIIRTFRTLFLLTVVTRPAFGVQPSVVTYDQLLRAIRETRAASQARIEQAVDQENVREAWETGKLIDEHILQHKARADYGKQVVIRLARDLGTSETELKYMLQFARTYPIRRPADELSWSQYQSLLALNNPEERDEVAKEAVRQKWTRDQMRAEVSRRKARADVPEEPEKLTTEPGRVGTYRVVGPEPGSLDTAPFLDLGFSTYFRPEKPLRFEAGDIVKLDQGKLVKAEDQSAAALFTYTARVREVIDGDTVSAFVHLGFGITTLQTLRLRALDAREIESTDGREAKAFLEKQFEKSNGEILIKTLKSDKYDRYLADVWAGDVYVNQALVDEGLAVVVNE